MRRKINVCDVGSLKLEKIVEKRKFTPPPRLVGVHPNPGPRRGERLSEYERYRIISLSKEEGLSHRQIARKMKINKQSVRNTLHKFRETNSVRDRPGRGRKRRVSEKEEKTIVRNAKKGKCAPQLAVEYQKRTGKSVSERTIRRVLKTHHLAYLKVTPIPRLTEDHIAQRLEYTQEMADVDWRSIIFSDEKSFWLETTVTHAWQERGKRKTVKKSRWTKKVHVWGAIGYFHKTKLFIFEKNLNAALYQTILRRHLPPACSPDCPRRLQNNWFFVQDNSRLHTTEESMAVLQELTENRLYKHPPNSPDLNIIEDIWSYMDRAVRHSKVTTLQGLKRTLTKLWNALDWGYVRTSVMSMPKRLIECTERKGERTHY